MEGRLTLPIEVGIDDEVHQLMERLGVDAVRNSDGTELPAWASDGLAKVYSTYFPSRGDEEWAATVPKQRVRQFLMSRPVTATSSKPLSFNVMEGYLAAQFAPDVSADRELYWQVIDRTTGQTLRTDEWELQEAPALPMLENADLVGEYPPDVNSAVVTISKPHPFHVYTADFLARQVWDSTQIYNYLTNNWAANPNKAKDRTYDVAYPETWERAQAMLNLWLKEHPEVDVVRFTTFFYHFTLAFDDRAREKYVDWFGYSAAVSIPALQEFAEEHGFAMLPEDFIDGGYYNSPFRVPSDKFRAWIDFTAKRVAEKAKVLVQTVHEQGREAMMFLGDNWIGTEPYGPYFSSIGLDAVVGSVGSAATCRMISDIPGVKYTEGRFLPYFFPDVFRPGGDPVSEASESWAQARRAIVRKPLDRIGYGGYLSLALQFPEFIDEIESIVTEFRGIHEYSEGTLPATAPAKVAVLNAWGSLRTWQSHMVAHALWYKQIYSYLGAIESLAGLPLDVRFISFDEVVQSNGKALADVDVVINAGALDTSFSGGNAWDSAELQQLIRAFVWNGGGFIGIGAPTGRTNVSGPVFALEDVIGADMEIGWGLSNTRHWGSDADSHFILTDLTEPLDIGEHPGDVVPTGTDFQVLRHGRKCVYLGVNSYGKGRSVYIAGSPYSAQNARLLHRAIVWSANKEDQWATLPVSSNPQIELGWYPQLNRLFVFNNSAQPQKTLIQGDTVSADVASVTLEGHGSTWIQL